MADRRVPAGGSPLTAPLTAEDFAAIADVSRETLTRLRSYADLLQAWQGRMNLIGPATVADVWRRHFLDSAQLFPLLPRPAGRPCRVLDLGSGAGFPGLVLAAMGGAGATPVTDVHLVEATEKKCAFLREAARLMEVAVTVHSCRIEALAPFAVDVVTARAVAPLPRLLALIAPFLHERGSDRAVALLAKGRNAPQELTDAAKHWKMRVESIPSITDPLGVVLRIGDIVRD